MCPNGKPITSRIVSLLCFLLVTLACDSNNSTQPTGSVFRYNEYRNITSLDPAFARNPQNIWAINQLFNGLVQLDNNLAVQPEIAKTWKMSNDGLTYTFTLRDDVFFHPSPHFNEPNKRKVVAQDFVYSFNRLTDPKVASPGSWVLQNVSQYSAIDDSTFEITLKKPFPAFLGLLSMRYCAVVPHEVIEFYGEAFRNHPIGTGPFYFKRWEENVKLVLRKNNHYFEFDATGNRLPYLEAVAIQFIADIQSEFMLFVQGKLDFINSLDSSYKDELLTTEGDLQPKYKGKIAMQKGAYLNTEYIGFYLDAESPVVRSPLIREAINIGFDREMMVAYLRNNIGYPAKKGFIPKGLPGTSKIPFDYKPDRARELVNTFKESSEVSPTLSLATDANYLDICEFLQRELEKIGIKVNIDVLPTATLRQAKSSGKLELFRASWIADYPDAENYLSLFYAPNLSPSGPNYTHFKNTEFDRLYEKALSIEDPKKRVVLYQTMDSLSMSKFPIVPLFYDQAIRFTQKNIKDFSMNPINLLILKTVKK